MPDQPFSILVIDDTEINRQVIEKLLRSAFPQCAVLTCAKPEDGLFAAQSHPLDIILLDVQMPGMDGVEVCRHLKASPETAAIPVLLMTAQGSDPELRIQGLDAGADDFICRPISNDELAARVRMALRIKRAEDRLRQQNEELTHKFQEQTRQLRRLEMAVESSPDLFAIIDRNHKYLQVNQALCHYFGIARQDIIGKTPDKLLGKTFYTHSLKEMLDRCLAGETVETSHSRHFPGLGTRHLDVRYFPFKDDTGETTGVVAILRDVTEETLAKAELEVKDTQLIQLGSYDPLTGLANARVLMDRLSHALAKARRFNHQVAILHIDLDRFNQINTSFGREEGDRLLKRQAKQLSSVCRESDTLARLSGDEFVLVMEQLHRLDDVMAVASNLKKALQEPFTIGEHTIILTCTIGISLYPGHGSHAQELLQRAADALTKAKKEEQGTYRFAGAQESGKETLESLLMESDLRQSLEKDQFELFYQPQFTLGNLRLVGMEALIRWHHPNQGLVLPGTFIPAAETSGLILPIGNWVLNEACRQAAQWQQFYPGLRVAVNISAQQFRQRDLPQQVAQALEESHLPPHLLELELTESVVMERVNQAIETMHRLSEMGVQLAIDDFGTGYSSLSYLRQFPIQRLKIDRSFVREVTTNESDAAIADSVIALARSMKLEVTAEGIENQEQLHFLAERGCHEGQGYLFSPPQPPKEHQELIQEAGASRKL